MRKDSPALGQKTTPFGGSLNLVPMTYSINEKPIGDEKLYGPLAYVSEESRKKIMDSGFGEMKLHVEFIKKRIGCLKKLQLPRPGIQLGLTLSE